MSSQRALILTVALVGAGAAAGLSWLRSTSEATARDAVPRHVGTMDPPVTGRVHMYADGTEGPLSDE